MTEKSFATISMEQQDQIAVLKLALALIVLEHNRNGGCRYSAELGKAIKAGAEVLAKMEED